MRGVRRVAASTAWRAALPVTTAPATQRRWFVDTPTSDPQGMDVPVATGSPFDLGSSSPAAAEYTYPLDAVDAPFKLYGEQAHFSNDAANRIFASAKTHSYDPAVLYSDLRLQDVSPPVAGTDGSGGGAAVGAGATAAAVAGGKPFLSPGGITAPPGVLAARGVEDDNDAVMREGRDKQGAAGAAVVAAAMLEGRRGADAGVAMVPGHPLPVVFPRPDGLPPPLRFVKKFGPGQSRLARSKLRQRRQRGEEEEQDQVMYGEVMESDGKIEGHSIKRSVALQVRVLDEQKRFTKVRQFQHFRELSDAMPARVMQGLANSHFDVPTLVQSAAIPQLMAGKDVIGIAPGGSGKIIAFAVPSIAVLLKVMASGDPRQAGVTGASGSTGATGAATQPMVLVLCPTRETVQRTAAMYASLTGEDTHVVAAYTSARERDTVRQDELLQEGCDVLVCTPARMHEWLAHGRVCLRHVRFVAIDGADRMLQSSEADQLAEAMERLRQDGAAHQTTVWASAMVPEVEAFTSRYLSPTTCTVLARSEEETNINVKQILYPLSSRSDRLEMIKKLYDHRVILKREQVVVYCVYKETAEALARELAVALSAPPSLVKYVHSGLRSRKRNQVLQEFKQGSVRILVGTDVSTKHLDVPDLEHVISYDLPSSTEVFARRVSEVGRGGRQGTAHTFLCPGDARVPAIARFVEQQTGRKLSEEINKLVDEVVSSGGENEWDAPLARIRDGVVAHLKWRVRGRRDRNDQRRALTDGGATPESDVQSEPVVDK